ncbi:hypothetical protein AAAA54_24255, partial [Escherichia coli]
MGSCAAPSAKGDDKFITTDYLQQCQQNCLMLHELWLQSGTEQRRSEGLTDDVSETITALYTAKR